MSGRLPTDLKIAKDLFSTQIAEFKASLDDDDVIMCLSSTTNFRKDIDPHLQVAAEEDTGSP